MPKLSFVILLIVGLVIIISGIPSCKNTDTALKSPHYWNQYQYDSIYHFIAQPRHLDLELIVDAPEKLVNKSFGMNVLGRYNDDDTLQFSEAGHFSQRVDYGGSNIRLNVPGEHLATKSAIEEIFYNWYYPGEWFKELKLDIFTEQVSANYRKSEKAGLVEIDVIYPEVLKRIEGSGSFGRLVGISLDFTGEYKQEKKMYWTEKEEAGKLTVIADVRNFFEKYHKSYSTPYKVGDKYRLYFSLTLELEQGLPETKTSNKKDPKYKRSRYKPGKWSRGNYNATIPEIDPQYQITIKTSKEITILAEHLDF